MGRASRWLSSLLGGRKRRREQKDHSIEDTREKKRWSFKLGRDSCDSAQQIPPEKPVEMAWLRSLYEETGQVQSKHDIAVAATAAAAVALLRLTSQRGSQMTFHNFHEQFAAVKIQTFYRGHLARRALRALKGVVKLQALFRGYLIRKQVAATLQSMKALINAQESVRANKFKALLKHKSLLQERFDDSINDQTSSIHSFDISPKIVEISTGRRSFHSQFEGRSSTPEWNLPFEKHRFSYTAQSTPRMKNSSGGGVGFAPTSSSPNFPNYMPDTQASEAKLRSVSALKQRPETCRWMKHVPLGEVVMEQSRASLSCHGIQRSGIEKGR